MVQHWHIGGACISFFFYPYATKSQRQIAIEIKTIQIYYLRVLKVRSPGLAKLDPLLRSSSGWNQAITWTVLFSEAGDLFTNLLGYWQN